MKSCLDLSCVKFFKNKIDSSQDKQQKKFKRYIPEIRYLRYQNLRGEQVHIDLAKPQAEIVNAQAPYKIPEPQDVQNIELPAFKNGVR